MAGDVTLDDVKFILSSESNFLRLTLDNMGASNLCSTKQKIRESRQRLTKALEILDALIQERELSAVGDSHG